MKDVITLTKILFKSSKTGKNNKNNKIRSAIFILAIYLYFIILIVNFSFNTLNVLKETNSQKYLLNAFIYFSMMYSIFHGIISTLNLLYFSKDIDYLLPMPIKPEKIVLAKINVIIISQYLMSALIFAPFFVVYGIVEKLSFIYYFVLVLVLLVINIIPVCITAIIVSLVMKMSKVVKNKDSLQYFSSFVAIALVVFMQFAISKTEGITSEEYGVMFANLSNNLNTKLSIFFSAKPIFNALNSTDVVEKFKNVGILYLETIITALIAIKVVSYAYLKTLYNIGSASKVRTKNKKVKYDHKPLVKSYVSKEFKLLVRNPIFFMQCVVPIVVFPLVILIPFIISIVGSYTSGEQSTLQESMLIIRTFVIEDYYILTISLIAALFLNMMNYVSITAVSREGANAVFMKSIPVPLYKQVLYKALPGIIFGMFPMFYLIIFAVLFGITSFRICLCFIICFMLINIYSNLLFVTVDIKRPKTNWISEYAVVKQNLNMLFQFFIMMVEIGIISSLIALKLNAEAETAIICVVYLVLIAARILRFKKKENRLLDNIY